MTVTVLTFVLDKTEFKLALGTARTPIDVTFALAKLERDVVKSSVAKPTTPILETCDSEIRLDKLARETPVIPTVWTRVSANTVDRSPSGTALTTT